MNMSADEIKGALPGFIGTMDYYRSSHFARNIYHTDGVQWLADVAHCYWLIDAIVSHQTNVRVSCEEFQIWTLKVQDRKGVLICGDGDDTPPFVTQEIPYTDFPLDEITLYLEDGSVDGTHFDRILMLPSER
jgi:uncharacterized protein DUF6876